MAAKRMFAKTIIDSDAFTEMPLSTQALYFHLSMRADDDGFLNNAKKIQREIGANQNDYDLLVAKRFIIQFDDGICVIKHWRIHNYIQNDRYKPTIYQEEKSMLGIKENNSYTLVGNQNNDCIQNVYNLESQVRLDKDSIDKDNIKEEFTNVHEYSKKYDDNSFEMKCVKHLINSIADEMPNARVPKDDKAIDDWCDHIERMKRLDKRSETDIWSTLLYATSDSFWKSNIRSTKKFRDKYETLFLQSKNKKQQPKATNKFNDFPQRTYDMSELEKKMLQGR